MKLLLKNSDKIANERLKISINDLPCLDSSWHYHTQYELLYISDSFGIRFVGNNISNFSPGEIVLVAPYLPHLWRNDTPNNQGNISTKVKTIVIRFSEDFIAKNTFKLAEFSDIKKLLENSKFGLSFGINTAKDLHNDLFEIVELSAASQSIKLLKLLQYLSLSNERQVLSTIDKKQYISDNSQRIDKVLNYISENYTSHITLEQVAELAGMTNSSFCRYFKKMTNKSFTHFLNEVRIHKATHLLIQEDSQITEVGYAVGYQSITNFNRQFKVIMGESPKSYRPKFHS